jgi:AraC family transcriptional regulator
LYDGWLQVERSAVRAMDEYVTESIMSFPGGWVETRRFKWSRPLESVYATTERCYMVNLSLSGWSEGGSARNLHASRLIRSDTIGRMRLIPPAQTLQIRSTNSGQSRSIRCLIDARLIDRYHKSPSQRDDTKRSSQAAYNLHGGQLEWLLRRMYRELHRPDSWCSEAIEALAQQLTVEIVRTLDPHREDLAAPPVGALAPWRLRLIRERLNGDGPLPKLEELGRLCNMTVRHLSRVFRGERGERLGQYVEAVMVNRANGMLQAGAAVGDVAAALGYATSTSFANAFRRATGLLPSEVIATAKAAGDRRTRTLHQS